MLDRAGTLSVGTRDGGDAMGLVTWSGPWR